MKRVGRERKSVPFYVWIFGGVFVLVVGGVGYVVERGFSRLGRVSNDISDLRTRIFSIESELATTTAYLGKNIEKTREDLVTELEEERAKSARLAAELGSVKQEVGSVSGTVSTLEKLSKTDPELLQKYSKVFFLNEHYAPERLTEIPNEYKYFEPQTEMVATSVWPYLNAMLDAASRAGLELYVFSGYRSFDEQRSIKGNYTVIYGAGTANQFSADQGYSEHQLGTTVDVITTGIGGTLSGFSATDAYRWLLDNAYKFGFILSYPENNDYYIFEPWHWRFVGVKLATDLHEEGNHFYDLKQREIDKYLADIFD